MLCTWYKCGVCVSFSFGFTCGVGGSVMKVCGVSVLCMSVVYCGMLCVCVCVWYMWFVSLVCVLHLWFDCERCVCGCVWYMLCVCGIYLVCMLGIVMGVVFMWCVDLECV